MAKIGKRIKEIEIQPLQEPNPAQTPEPAPAPAVEPEKEPAVASWTPSLAV